MPELSDDIKTFIVVAFATYARPAEIVRAVKAEYNVTVSRQQVQFYNPDRGGEAKRLDERWRNLHAETRRQYDAAVASIPISRLSYRLTRLQRMAELAEAQGNKSLAADLYKQAAQDQGGMFTNTRKIKVDDPAKALADLLGVSGDELPDELQESVH